MREEMPLQAGGSSKVRCEREESERESNVKGDWTARFAENLWLKPDGTGEDEAAFIRRALHLRRGQSVLDAPCGAGRIAIHLARAGCAVTGIDLRPSFIARAAARFRREKKRGRFMATDLRAMDFDGEFDAAFCWQGSFGYFGDVENRGVVKRYARALRKRGRLLIDQPNREYLLRHFRSKRSDGNTTIVTRWDRKSARVESDWIIRSEGKRSRNPMSMRLYTPGEMRSLFRQSGLEVEALYGSIGGEPYRRSSRRLIVVGRKPWE